MPEAASPITSSSAAAPASAPRSAPAAAPSAAFAETLRGLMAEPRDRIADVRAEVAALRNGGVLRRGSESLPSLVEAPTYARFAAPAGRDPFGWRALARSLGDSVVGPGFGEIFERQIAQESGFDPGVAYGLRRSSAGAEGIAQLMPEYYPGVDRTDPAASLLAGAQSMRHYLAVWDGDVRKALASYNAGLGRVQALVRAHGEDWERALPAETQRYLAAITGDAAQVVEPAGHPTAAIFGGRGPGGVLVAPLDAQLGQTATDLGLTLLGTPGSAVRAPADGRVVEVIANGESATVVLDHGNGWRTRIVGVEALRPAPGDEVRRGAELGALAAGGSLGFQVLLDGRRLDPQRYLLSAAS